MVNLQTSDAVELVRKNLDELDPNGSIMYYDENGSDGHGDNLSLDDIIYRTIPEAINKVHLAAPVHLLEGLLSIPADDIDLISLSDDGILSFRMVADLHLLRLVAFQAADSSVVVTDVIGEDSPEGRKQLNPYIRGRADRPRLVLLQGERAHFKYYSIDSDIPVYKQEPRNAILMLSYIPEQFFNSEADSYSISSRLRQNIIDCLTAMVLETYSDQRSQQFYQRANNYPRT